MQIKYAIIHVAKNKMNKMTFRSTWHRSADDISLKTLKEKLSYWLRQKTKCKFNIRFGQIELQSNLSLHWIADMTFKPICKIKVNLRWKKSIWKMYPCITIANWFSTSIKKKPIFIQISNIFYHLIFIIKLTVHQLVWKWMKKQNVIIRANSVISHLQAICR